MKHLTTFLALFAIAITGLAFGPAKADDGQTATSPIVVLSQAPGGVSEGSFEDQSGEQEEPGWEWEDPAPPSEEVHPWEEQEPSWEEEQPEEQAPLTEEEPYDWR